MAGIEKQLNICVRYIFLCSVCVCFFARGCMSGIDLQLCDCVWCVCAFGCVRLYVARCRPTVQHEKYQRVQIFVILYK